MTTPAPFPPHPPRWPLVGHLPRLRGEGMLSLLEDSWRKLGDVFSVDVGMHAVVVAHPDGIKRILAGNAKNYVKGSTYDGVRRVIGNGVLALEGDAWKARRTLMNPAFHRAALGKLTEAMAQTGQLVFDGLLNRHGGPFTVDAHREMVKLTLDVVTVALFGRELLGAADISYESLGAALELVSEQGNGFVMPKWVPTPGNRKFHRTMAEVEGVIYRVIEAGRRRPPGDGTLLSMLIHSIDAETNRPLTDQELRDEVFTLFVAGHETTALTLTWLFTLLHGRDDVMKAMKEEVDRVLGGREPGFEDYPKLVYLRQVVDETLRLRGPVAMTARNVVADDEVLGVRVRAGDVVMPYFYGAHRHKDFWTDPERFDPGHFAPEKAQGRNPWSYLPFSAGQRQCIGNTFSLVETVVLLAQLITRFDVEVDPSVQDVKPVAMVTVRPDRPVMVKLTPRAARS
ncbi:MAG: cytochrome P450 [Archangiaceae bacterium]|nr:cytochrome P450 [Archangiaceae bacterium]